MQISIFDGTEPFKIIKPIRLITLFSGYDSQALSLKYLGIPFEHYHTCEWAIPSIQALKDLHFDNDNSDYSVCLSKAELVDILYEKGVSSDYNKPLTKKQLSRYPETKLRTIFNNIIATKNLVSICNINGKDLEICNTDKYEYIMTYSFPCQDLSSAGKGAGMAKGSGTRSGLLWEVERLLDGCEELPQVLLMENVPEVIGTNNIKHFAEWVAFLDSIGYRSKWGLLNAKDFGIAQNRNRCFMVSVLGDYYYDMPTGFKLEHVLKDFLDKQVDESYYLKDCTIKALNEHKERHEAQGNGFGWKPSNGVGIAHTIKTEGGYRPQSNFIIEQSNDKCKQVGMLVGGKWDKMHDIAKRAYSADGLSPTLHTCGGGNLEPKILEEPIAYDEQNGYLRKDGIVVTLTTDGSSPKHNNRIVEPPERFFKQALDTAKSNECEVGDTIDAFNGKINKSGISPTITTRPEGFKTAILPIDQQYRVRKLTERECFKLMGVKQEDFEKIRENQSKSSCYHLAGDSIVTTVLMAIFGQMFDIDWKAKINELAEELTND